MRVSPSLSPACFAAPLHNIAFMYPNIFASSPPPPPTYSLFLFNVTLVAASTLKVPGLLSRLCRQFSLPQIELESPCVTPVILCARQRRGLSVVKFCNGSRVHRSENAHCGTVRWAVHCTSDSAAHLRHPHAHPTAFTLPGQVSERRNQYIGTGPTCFAVM